MVLLFHGSAVQLPSSSKNEMKCDFIPLPGLGLIVLHCCLWIQSHRTAIHKEMVVSLEGKELGTRQELSVPGRRIGLNVHIAFFQCEVITKFFISNYPVFFYKGTQS